MSEMSGKIIFRVTNYEGEQILTLLWDRSQLTPTLTTVLAQLKRLLEEKLKEGESDS
jgi:hypothetical protein